MNDSRVAAVRVDSSSSSPERADEGFRMNDGGSWFLVGRAAAIKKPRRFKGRGFLRV